MITRDTTTTQRVTTTTESKKTLSHRGDCIHHGGLIATVGGGRSNAGKVPGPRFD
ncbi:hypothetical protein RISK_002158 [Rhodopirellula islandica]|uniref:Uncharacterized protein n=1 Tax=Rhodopirellula islandica TaxID=595434 RepID=A0A0J1BG72_RHOIS|nr:hypothetical protein RISK_002158 [Rhodopirellula islandica]